MPNKTLFQQMEEVAGVRAKPIDALLTEKDVSRVTGRAVQTLQKDRLYGTGIPFVRLGRLVRYRPSDVQAHLAALPTLRSTSDPGTRARSEDSCAA